MKQNYEKQGNTFSYTGASLLLRLSLNLSLSESSHFWLHQVTLNLPLVILLRLLEPRPRV